MAVLKDDIFEKRIIKLLGFYRKKLNKKACYSRFCNFAKCYSDGYSLLDEFKIFYVKQIKFCKQNDINTIKIFVDTEDKTIEYIYFSFPNIAFLKYVLDEIKVVEN